MKRACDVPISAMTPVEGGHLCPECDKTVYDLRQATREEALALFARSDATPCVRILPDARGFARLRRSRTAAMAVGAAILASTAMGCSEDGRDHEGHPGEPHTDEHSEEIGMAGEPVMVEDEVPPPPETDPPEGQ